MGDVIYLYKKLVSQIGKKRFLKNLQKALGHLNNSVINVCLSTVVSLKLFASVNEEGIREKNGSHTKPEVKKDFSLAVFVLRLPTTRSNFP